MTHDELEHDLKLILGGWPDRYKAEARILAAFEALREENAKLQADYCHRDFCTIEEAYNRLVKERDSLKQDLELCAEQNSYHSEQAAKLRDVLESAPAPEKVAQCQYSEGPDWYPFASASEAYAAWFHGPRAEALK